jgi:hypothetical protein
MGSLGRPVEGLRRRSIAAELDVELQLGLRLDGLGGPAVGAGDGVALLELIDCLLRRRSPDSTAEAE